ncbi:TPA: hypothetical protein ACH3X3_001115 [Trebouxia sp. C0006]
MKEKMLVRLEKERLQARTEALEAQVKVLEGAQPSTTMKSQAGLGGGSLAATQQRGPATPGSPNQQTMKGFNKSGKGMTARPMGATLPVSLLLHVGLLRTTPVHLLLQWWGAQQPGGWAEFSPSGCQDTEPGQNLQGPPHVCQQPGHAPHQAHCGDGQ